MWGLFWLTLIVAGIAALVGAMQASGDRRKRSRPSARPQRQNASYSDAKWKADSPWKPKQRSAYRRKFWLMNKTEVVLFNRLQEALPTLAVFSQVSMSQVFYFNARTPDTYTKLGEIGRKSIDFLICRRSDTRIIAAIELNGPTHEREAQKVSDEKKRAALEEAGIPLLIYKPDALPDVDTIQREIAPLIDDGQSQETERPEQLQTETP